MIRSLRRWTTTLAALSLALLTMPPAMAQSPGSIVSADTRAWAAQQLDTAESALEQGDIETAWKATEAAARAPEKFHGRGLASISARELGDDLYGRVFRLRKAIRTELGRQAEEAGLVYSQPGTREATQPWQWDTRDALTWYMGAPDPDAVSRLARTAPADRRILLRMLGSISANDEGEVEYGVGRVGSGVAMSHEPLWDRYEPLPEELALQRRFEEEVVPAILGRMQEEAEKLMAAEQRLYERPMTDMEKQGTSGDWQAMAAAVTGVEAEETAPAEVQLRLFRAGESRDLLKEAKEWHESLTVPVRIDGEPGVRRAIAVPVLERAAARAEEMMSIGDDTGMPLMTRAEAYDEAQDYYAIADDRERTELAYEKRSALQPEIDAYLARREAALEKAAEEGRNMANEMEQSLKDMEKTEEEKKAFKEEADALEDELGF